MNNSSAFVLTAGYVVFETKYDLYFVLIKQSFRPSYIKYDH